MRYKYFLSSLLFFSTLPALADVSSHFESIKSNPKALYSFLKSMPKGGELHYHLAGGAYPEKMIAVAKQKNFCINKLNYTVEKTKTLCHNLSLDDVSEKPKLYLNTLKAWSMLDFSEHKGKSGHDHFFESFNKFLPIVTDYRPQLIASVIKRAASQKVNYLEIMILPDNAQSSAFGPSIKNIDSIAAKKKNLLAQPDFQKNIRLTITESQRILSKARRTLKCHKKPDSPACKVKVKFLYYLLREQELDHLIAQAVNGFEAASHSEDIVGINLVQAEDDTISTRDYRRQMAVFNELHRLYPNVHIALHAGEVTADFVPPEELDYRIREAIFIGQAERIGHGVSIKHEKNPKELANYMSTKQIPVEINLTSNQKILNVSGSDHPLSFYLSHQVPVVLSTDDEGILRTNLTQEYYKAATTHRLDYQTLKTINRNALTYSFVSGKSIWKDPKQSLSVPECHHLDSDSCKQFIRHNEKGSLQWQLEKQLASFEQGY